MSPTKFIPAAAIAALFLLPLVAAAQGDQTMIVPVQLSEFRFTPSEILLNNGQHYILRLTDSGKHDHSLSAKAFFASVDLDPTSASAIHDGEVELTSGASADVAFTPRTAGTYEMHCSHPAHAMFGMTGHITVR